MIEIDIDKLKRRLNRLKEQRDKLQKEHDGNQLKYTYWGGYNLGYLKGQICRIESILDELNEEQTKPKQTMRYHREVLKEIIDKIPTIRENFKTHLQGIYEDSFYKAPESKIPWDRTCEILNIHIPTPKEEWEYEVVSIFTTIPIEKLKEKYGG